MASPRVLVLRAPGTNCDEETAFAFERAGSRPTSMHINQLLEQSDRIEQFQIVCLPGGFSYGDDVAAGRILANQIRHHLEEKLRAFQEAGKLILGICNGFQVLMKSGLLLPDQADRAAATLTWNDSGRFEDRWVRLHVDGNKSPFLQGIETMYLPVAHAEGKFVTRDRDVMRGLDEGDQLALRDCSDSADDEVPYPANPNGSQANVAGVCDATGRVFGLMPHPERFIDRTQHPRWTRETLPEQGDGMAVFLNAVAYFG